MAILICLIFFLAGGVVVLASWCGHLTHRMRDLRYLLSVLTQRTMSDMAKRLIDMDKHSHN